MFLTRKKIPVLPVCTIGAPELSAVSQLVPAVDDRIRQLAEDMYRSLVAFDGIGLAAPQIGVNLRLVVFDVPEPEKDASEPLSPGEEILLPLMPFAAVNPEIVSYSQETAVRDEGCLSVPDLFAPVVRPRQVLFRTSTLDGQMIECEAGGLLGRCIQHELDHLDGVLFTDRVSPETAAKIAARLDKMRASGRRCNFRRTRR